LTSLMLADAYTPLDGRILGPAQLFWLVGFVALLSEAEIRLSSVRFFRLLPAAFLLILLLLNIYVTIPVAAQSYYFGLGYTHESSRNAETLKLAASFPEDTVLYSNAPDLLHLYTSHTVRWIPRKYDPYSLHENRVYVDEFQSMTRALEQQCALLVYFYSAATHSQYLPDKKELDRELSGFTIASRPDGTIYAAGDCAFVKEIGTGPPP
jgi:hypothetical protein